MNISEYVAFGPNTTLNFWLSTRARARGHACPPPPIVRAAAAPRDRAVVVLLRVQPRAHLCLVFDQGDLCFMRSSGGSRPSSLTRSMAFFGPSLELEPALVRLANRIWSYHGPYLVWSRPGGICGSICEYAPYFVILQVPLADRTRAADTVMSPHSVVR